MNMAKRTVCFLLVTVLLLGAGLSTANAQTQDPSSDWYMPSDIGQIQDPSLDWGNIPPDTDQMQAYSDLMANAIASQTRTLNVQRQSQEMSFWCGPAVGSMIARFHGAPAHINQSWFSVNIHGSVVNRSTSINQIRDALRIANPTIFGSGQTRALNNTTYSSHLVPSIVTNGRPVMIHAAPRHNHSLMGHFYLAFAVENTENVRMHDPWATRAAFSNTRVSRGELIQNGWWCVALGFQVVGIGMLNY